MRAACLLACVLIAAAAAARNIQASTFKHTCACSPLLPTPAITRTKCNLFLFRPTGLASLASASLLYHCTQAPCPHIWLHAHIPTRCSAPRLPTRARIARKDGRVDLCRGWRWWGRGRRNKREKCPSFYRAATLVGSRPMLCVTLVSPPSPPGARPGVQVIGWDM